MGDRTMGCRLTFIAMHLPTNTVPESRCAGGDTIPEYWGPRRLSYKPSRPHLMPAAAC